MLPECDAFTLFVDLIGIPPLKLLIVVSYIRLVAASANQELVAVSIPATIEDGTVLFLDNDEGWYPGVSALIKTPDKYTAIMRSSQNLVLCGPVKYGYSLRMLRV